MEGGLKTRATFLGLGKVIVVVVVVVQVIIIIMVSAVVSMMRGRQTEMASYFHPVRASD